MEDAILNFKIMRSLDQLASVFLTGTFRLLYWYILVQIY